MPKSEPRNVCISTVWRKTEATLLRQNMDGSGARSVSEYLRAAGLGRPGIGIARHDLQELWGEAALLSDRLAAAEPGKAQKAVLVAARVFFERAAAALQSPPRGV